MYMYAEKHKISHTECLYESIDVYLKNQNFSTEW